MKAICEMVCIIPAVILVAIGYPLGILAGSFWIGFQEGWKWSRE